MDSFAAALMFTPFFLLALFFDSPPVFGLNCGTKTYLEQKRIRRDRGDEGLMGKKSTPDSRTAKSAHRQASQN